MPRRTIKSGLLFEQNVAAKMGTTIRSMMYEMEGVKAGDTLSLRKAMTAESGRECPEGTQVVVSRFYQKKEVPRNKDLNRRGVPRGHYVIGFLRMDPTTMIRANLGKFEGFYFKPKK